MRGSAVADVVKVWVWAIGSLLLGLCLTPVAFNGGKALSELSGSKDFNGIVNKLAAWSGAAGLGDFFRICWPLTALLLLFPLIEWLSLAGERSGKSPWRIRLPHNAGVGNASGQPIEANRWGLIHGLAGFTLTFGFFVLIGLALVKAGAFIWQSGGWLRSLWSDVGWALSLAIVIEVFFRCVVLGIFFRAMKPLGAIMLAAVMFGGIHFILSGFEGALAVDGETLTASQLTAMLFAGGERFQRFVTVFLPWFAFGCVLGWARWRTASLWLPTGLLAGWLLVDRLFSKATEAVAVPDRLGAYFAAESVHNGIIPLLGVITVGGFVHVITHGYSLKRNTGD